MFIKAMMTMFKLAPLFLMYAIQQLILSKEVFQLHSHGSP